MISARSLSDVAITHTSGKITTSDSSPATAVYAIDRMTGILRLERLAVVFTFTP